MVAEEIVKKLQDFGYEAYFAGGCVRDMLLDIKPKDKDIATSATPEELTKIFKDNEIKSVGKSFLVTFIDGIEVATFRKDKYRGLDDKNVKVKSVRTSKEDSERRDLTINAMFFDPISNKVIDYVNGQDDLKKRIIRFVGDPEKRIWEDPNRIIRACRFYAKIDGYFDDNTFETLLKKSNYIQNISPERIRIEILKSMEIKKASLFFRALYDIGVLIYIFPSLHKCYNHSGGPYHIEPVFDHCMSSGDHCSTKFPLIKLASYLHDIGKPISCRINPLTNDIWFEGHDHSGAKEVEKELKFLRFSNDEISYIKNLIYHHMRISHERLSPKSIRRTLKSLVDNNILWKDLLRVSISDKMGNYKSSKYYSIKDVYSLVKSFKTEVNRKDPVNVFSDLKINGFDVMKITGLNPGKEVGLYLKYLLDLVVDNPELNERDKLIDLIIERKKKECV